MQLGAGTTDEGTKSTGGGDAGAWSNSKQRKWWVVVMVDIFSKWAEVVPIQDTSVDVLAAVFQHEWIDRYKCTMIKGQISMGLRYNKCVNVMGLNIEG